jgi:hypothetical protein
MNTESNTQASVKAIDTAMSAIFADIKAIEKGKLNTFFKFKFRGIDDIYEALHPIFAAHKVFLRVQLLDHETEDRDTREGTTLHHIVKVRYTFRSGEDGSEISSVAIGEASDTGDKGATKAMSIALKYLMLQTFLIPVDAPEDDADHDGAKFSGQAQPRQTAPAPRPTTSAAQHTPAPRAKPAAPASAAGSPGDAIVPCGAKSIGKRLHDLPAADVYWWADKWEGADKPNASEAYKAFKSAARAYADELEQNQDTERPPASSSAPANNDNIPY